MWKKKLKKRKTQFIFIGLILFVLSAILSMCLCYTLELKEFAKTSLTEENCPDAFITAIGSDVLSGEIEDTEVRKKILRESAITGVTVSVPIIFQENSISLYHQMMLNASQYKDWGYIWPDCGMETMPGKNEVWIAKKVSISQNIKLGDTLTLAYDTPVTLTVTGIYKAGFAPAVSNAFAPILVSPELIAEHPEETVSSIFAVDVQNYNEETMYEIADQYDYDRQVLTRDKLQNQVSTFSSLLSGFGVVSVFLVFLIALVVLRFLVKNNLMQEFREIGIYKSLGFSQREIRGFYSKGCAVVGVLSIFPGVLASLPMTYALGAISTQCLDHFRITGISIFTGGLVFLVLFFLFMLNVRIALLRTAKISPVEAIREGLTQSDQAMAHGPFRSACSNPCVAINQIFQYKKTSFLTCLIFASSLFLCLMFSRVLYTFHHPEEVTDCWFAIPEGNCYLTGNLTDEVFDALSMDSSVEKETHGYLGYAPVLSSRQFPELSLREVRFDVYSDATPSITGIPIAKGTEPVHSDEIAITTALASKLSLKPGDYLSLTVLDTEGEKVNGDFKSTTKEFFITGLYHSLFSQQGIMILENGIKTLVPSYQTDMCFLTLKEGTSFEVFRDRLQTQFSSVSLDKHWFSMENSTQTIQSMIVTVSSILMGVFALFFLINILILLFLEQNSRRHSHAVLKALGFSSHTLVRISLWKFSLLSVAGTIAALLLHAFVTNMILSAIMPDGFLSSFSVTALVVGFFYLVLLLLAWLLARNTVTRISLRKELIS